MDRIILMEEFPFANQNAIVQDSVPSKRKKENMVIRDRNCHLRTPETHFFSEYMGPKEFILH
ncbi:hypothetical protein BKA66DRAFT_472262 [Pyrenochaeta sp. MPI-SDFR-AT-0127]|nr:hypothetical protein BKA66DRAFT_472262 [Pyrenochaeta sp. MPI-SDFR-AT-0127]